MIKNELTLVIPALSHKQDAMDFRQEWLDKEPGESIHGSGGLHRYENYEEWLEMITNAQKTASFDWVLLTQYFGIYNGKIIGTIQIRHYLNDFLLRSGGHIGYSIRPTERRKGYGAQTLNLALDYCKRLGLKKIMLGCYKDNIASVKTIEKCGGVCEKEITYIDGKPVLIYWIQIENK